MTSPTVNIAGAAEILKVHPQTVRDLINAGNLPAARVGSAYVLLTKHVLDYAEKAIMAQTADRLISKSKPRSPKRVSKVSASQIGVTH
ncbi:excisionase family DNA binding protein [Comamonas odontotermitis]|uniref:Excisionase family DNA binding protein n=1 Tax=Comamonas odontotermitis TaxID=379895 RepID=A0ABR6RLB1_9BURK|nr:helix-turn-helix domain-containing protein [Comamonas odontotermitis]MBB6579968.1 excisionase family DNA binding protein [Comamonas odontotermitis]